MGSGNMALSEGLLLCLVGVAVGQFSEALLETSTPVPILRYIDSQNADGSYTYGFEGADGTYKIETRLADGQVRGKYGYYDPEGVLREATYGATKEGGFEPQIDGVILPPKQPAPLDPRRNEVEPVQQQPTAPRRFSNFSPRKAAGEARKIVSRERQGQDIKIVNGRRAVLKRRLVKRPPTARPEEVVRRENLRARRLRPPLRGGGALGLCPPSATPPRPPLLSPTSATALRLAATPSAISWSTTTSYTTNHQ